MKGMTMRERHRLYHGTVNPEKELNLPLIAPRRTIVSQYSSPVTPTPTGLPPPHLAITAEEIQLEASDCHYCQLAAFSTRLRYPVTISNVVDTATLPPNFKFIEESILREGADAADEDFRTGCDCDKDTFCELRGCNCLQDVGLAGASPGPRTKVYSYISRGLNKGCLREALLESRAPIYECHEKCNCSKDCNNRVVERGRKIPLEIFRTSDGRGWGVRSSKNIQEGQFIDKYVGEIITGSEAQRRRKTSDIAKRKDVYLFALDKFSDRDSMDPRLAGKPFEVDGEFISGPTRFINHSCDPNLRQFARVGDHADKHIHDLAFFAICDIPAGEELTFDYVDGVDGEDIELAGDARDPTKRGDMVKCLCESATCRGFLW